MQHDLMKISNNITTTGRDLGKAVYALGNTDIVNEEDLRVLIPLLQASNALLNSAPVFYGAGTAIAAGTGFAAGKVIDTNDNPSNFKTAATALGSNYIASVLSNMIGDAFLNAQLSKIDMQHLLIEYPELSPRKARKVLKAYQDSIPANSNQIPEHVFQKANISRQNFENLLNDARNAFVIASSLTSVISLIFMGMTVSNAIHGYRRNDKSVGYALAWMCTGPGGFGLSRAQGWGSPSVSKDVSP